jgi:molybdopterin-binding protein
MAARRRKAAGGGRAGRTLRLGEAAKLLGVSPDTVRRWVDAGRLRATRTAGGQRAVDGAELARFAADNAKAGGRMRSTHSARNRFSGIVTRIVRDKVAAQVEIQAGPHRLVSLLTREAVDELGLAPGVRAVALVKATHVTVERADGR